MNKVRLGDVATQIRGVSYKPDDILSENDDNSIGILRANNIQEELELSDIVYIRKDRVKDYQLLKKDDILICASSGSKNLVGKSVRIPCDLNLSFGAFCKVVRPNIQINVDYFSCFFQSDYYRTYISNISEGANINNIKNEHIDNLLINFPNESKQLYDSQILLSLFSIIKAKKKQIQKLDTLVKSRFVEMFGDPVKNTKHIKTKRGIEIFKLSNGKAVPVEKRFDQGIPAYGGNGISWYTNEILAEQDTLVIGRVGFQSGNVHFARAPLWITDNAMYISSLDNKCYDIIFLCALMEHIDFTRYQDAGDLKKITQKPFMNTEFIAPPIEMQKKYVSFVEQTNKSKLAVQKSIEKLEILKKSLMQEYFG